MRRYPYLHLDVFTERPFRGNQLAVVFDADTLDAREMQAIAREMNFSESTFVLAPSDPASALRRVRIFTPGGELPFAGHPVIGTAVALVETGHITADNASMILELGVGPLKIEPVFNDGVLERVWMDQPAPAFTPWMGDRPALVAALGLDEPALRPDLPVTVGSAGVPHILVPLRDRAALARARHGAGLAAALAGDDLHTGVYLYTTPTLSDEGQTVYARMFAPGMGIAEDAATGSAAGPLGAFLALRGVASVDGMGRSVTQIVQGVEMGRRSEITVETLLAAGAVTSVRVAGMAYVIATGEFTLPDTDAATGGEAGQ